MNPLIECLGWTLVHFVWQGVVVALLLAIALRLLRRAPASQRYLAGCIALLLMVTAPLVTAHFVAKHADPAPVVQSAPIEVSPNPAVAALQVAVQPARLVVKAKAIWVQPELTQRLDSVLPWLVMAWFLGVFALSCRLLIGWLKIKQWQRAASSTLAEPWYEKLAELARGLSISRPVRLVQSALVEVPTVIGWLRPVVLLPASCVTGLSPGQLESILAHELAHIHRHDYLINLLQSAVETLLFYHPAVWWVSRRIREERENCCDDIAVKICGDPVAYARALATLEEMRSAPAQLAMAADGAPLLQRIQRLLGKSGGTASPMAWPLAGTIVVVALMTIAIGLRETRAMASEPPKPESFITTSGIYHYTNSGVVRKLTIQTNRVFLSASKGTSLTTAGVGEGNWVPKRHWFVYIGKDWHIWAYDGAQGLWVIAGDSLSSKVRPLAYLDEIPPDAVLKRLPKDLKKTVLDIATPNDEKRREFEQLIREAEAQSKEQRHLQDSKGREAKQTHSELLSMTNRDGGVSTAMILVTNGTTPMTSWKVDTDSDVRPPETRTFHVEAQSLFEGLEKAGFYKAGGETNKTSEMKKLQTAFRNFFASNRIEFPTNAPTGGRAIIYNDKAGILFVRAGHAEMNKIAASLKKMLGTSVQSETIEDLKHAREIKEAREFQEARLLFDSGHLHEAELKFYALCDAWINADVHHAAQKYLLRIIERRLDEARKETGEKPTGDVRRLPEEYLRIQEQIKREDALFQTNATTRTNIFHISKGRQAILDKLKSIRLDSVEYDEVPFERVINNLYEQVRLHDPDKTGINFFFDREISPLAPAPATANPATGQPPPTKEAGDIGSVKVRISPALTNAQLGSVLQAITKNSNIPIKFAVYDYGIGFSLRGHETQPMEMRTFHVDPNTFEKGLESFTGIEFGNLATTSRTNYTYLLQIMIRSLFSAAGVDFPTNTLASSANPVGTNNSRTAGRAIFYNDRSGMLFVRATSEDLAKVQSALDSLLIGDAPATIPKISSHPPANTSPIQEDRTEPHNVTLIDGNSTVNLSLIGTSAGMDNWTMDRVDSNNQFNNQWFYYRTRNSSNVPSASAPPASTNPPTNVNAGNNATVAATGASPLAYQWYFNGTNIAPATYEIPQIKIKVKFLEITEAAGKSNGFTSFLADSWVTFKTNPAPPPKFVSADRLKNSNSTTHVELTVTNSIVSQSTAILNDAQTVLAVQTMPRRNDINILTTPDVTTLDNRQAQIQAFETMSVILATNSTLADVKASPHPLVELFGFGPTFDVVPKLSDDGLSIKLKMTASVTEFKGYANTNPPMPQLYGQKLEAEETVPDGQTVILAGQGVLTTVVMKDKVAVLGDIPLLGRLFQSKSTSTVRKNLLVFVTPTLIHADGTPIHPHTQFSSKQP